MGIFDFLRPSVKTQEIATEVLRDEYGLSSINELRDFGLDPALLGIPGIGPNSHITPRSENIDDPTQNIAYEPAVGWDTWCQWAAKQGKIAANIHSLAKNMMYHTFKADTKEELKAWNKIARRIHWKMTTIDIVTDWEIYGRTFIQVVKQRQYGNRKAKLLKIQRMNPAKIKIIWNTVNSTKQLNDWLISTHQTKYCYKGNKGYTGTEIVAFVQNWDDRYNLVNGKTPAVYFDPSELIYIPRYPGYEDSTKDGISLLRENQRDITNKIIIEMAQAIMARRHVDPKLVFSLPEKWWNRRDKVINEIKDGIRRGLDIFVPTGFELSTLEVKTSGEMVTNAQKHIEEQVASGMSIADSFTNSSSSNRSVGEIQLIYLERNLAPERILFAEYFEDYIINPCMRELGYAGTVEMRFEDLTPEDIIEKLRIAEPLVPFMTKSMVMKYFVKLGFEVDPDELDELMENLQYFVPERSNEDRDQPRDPSTGVDDADNLVKGKNKTDE